MELERLAHTFFNPEIAREYWPDIAKGFVVTLKLGLARPLWIRAGKPAALSAAVGTRAVAVPDAAAFVATVRGLRPV